MTPAIGGFAAAWRAAMMIRRLDRDAEHCRTMTLLRAPALPVPPRPTVYRVRLPTKPTIVDSFISAIRPLNVALNRIALTQAHYHSGARKIISQRKDGRYG